MTKIEELTHYFIRYIWCLYLSFYTSVIFFLSWLTGKYCCQGLSFAFPIPSQYAYCCRNVEGIHVQLLSQVLSGHSLIIIKTFWLTQLIFLSIVAIAAELPLEFPDGTTPVTSRVCVYDGSSDSKVGVGSILNKATVPPLPSGSLYMEEVHAKVTIF